MLEQPERLNADDLIAVEIAVEAAVPETTEGVVPTVVLLVGGRVGPDFTTERTVRIHMLAEEVEGVVPTVVLLVGGRVGPDFTTERTVRIHMLAEEVEGVSERILRTGARAMDLARQAQE